MRYVAWIVVAVLLVGCDRDPYMSRKGGYTPGEPYPAARSTAYAAPDDYYRTFKGIHPGSQM
jgi:hypothetical protein